MSLKKGKKYVITFESMRTILLGQQTLLRERAEKSRKNFTGPSSLEADLSISDFVCAKCYRAFKHVEERQSGSGR